MLSLLLTVHGTRLAPKSKTVTNINIVITVGGVSGLLRPRTHAFRAGLGLGLGRLGLSRLGLRLVAATRQGVAGSRR